jgi:putative tricarboxylic transport membrane protein
VLGVILGPLAEQQLRRALQISQNDPTVLVTSPFSATLLAVALLFLVVPPVLRRWQRRTEKEIALESEREEADLTTRP